jgi:type I restriction enzyme, S subunit
MMLRNANWPQVSLADHVDLLTGFPFKSARYTDDAEDIRLLRGDNIAQGHLRWDGVKRWPGGEQAEYTKFDLHAGDVILAMDRPWIEAGLKWGWVRSGDLPCLLVQRVSRLRGIRGLSTAYLRYLIGSESFTDYIKPIVTGVNVPHISAAQIKDFRFNLPPAQDQDRIASILSAYDDLIENNTRRIAILEEMARALYQEWFVHFRFPGHEHVPLVDSPLGPIPKGWEVAKLGDVCEKVTDGAHHSPKSIDSDDGMPMASVKDMHDWGLNLEGCRRISMADFGDLKRNHCRPRRGDILIAKDGANLNKHTFLVTEDDEVVLLSSIAIITPGERVRPEFMCEQLKEPSVSKRIKRSVSGAAIPRIILKDFKKLLLVVPPLAVQNEWERLACPLLNLCRNLVQRNKILRTTRDLLLPKLISGEIDVSTLSQEPIAEAAD